jgi:excisionase family DNA binding protein
MAVMSADEVAVLLHVRRSTVMNLYRRGALPALRISPRCIRFLRADVIAYLAYLRRQV